MSLFGTGGQNVSVTSSGAPSAQITYTIGATVYSSDNAGSAPPAWLRVDSTGTTTPATLGFGLSFFTAGLIEGVHQATVTLTPTSPAGVAPVTITVTYTSGSTGGGGGGSNTLSASPGTTINLSSGVSSTTSANVTINTTSVSAINITMTSAVSSGSTNWLSTSALSSTINSTGGVVLTIYANSFNLVSGSTYQGTVTVTPSTGTPLTITVNFTVGTGGSTGGWFLNPSTVAWTFTTNSGFFPNQAVTLNTTSGQTTYSVNTTQNSSFHWLLVNINGSDVIGMSGIAVGTPFTLKVGSLGNNLAQGVYSDQAVITDSNGIEVGRVTVTLTVNGGNSAGLTLNPTSLTFTAALNGAQQSQVVNVTSTSGGTLTVTSSLPTGLSYTLPANPTIGPGGTVSFTVFANPFGLQANTYTGALQVQVGSQSGNINVSLVVGGGGGTGTGTTAVAPTSLNFSHHFGTTLPVVPQKLVVTGPAGAWSSAISNGTPWLRFAPGGGSALPNPAIDGDTPIVSIDPTGLPVGTHSGNISITTAGGTQIVTVSVSVLSSVILLPNPGTLIFSAQTGQAKPAGQSTYFSDSDSTLNVNSQPITAVANNPWISITTGFGSVSVQVDQSSLSTGVYSGSVSVTQVGAANSPIAVPVILVVNGGGGGGSTTGTLSFSQSPITFTSVNGSTPFPTVLSVSSTASTSFVGAITYNSGTGGWLTVSPLSGVTPSNLSISANPSGLAVGSYGASIAFTANGVIQTVGVTLIVTTSGGGNTGNVTVNPTSLTFSTPSGSNPGAQSIKVDSASGSAGVSFAVQITAGSSWLSTSANTNPTTSYSFTVGVISSSMAPGSYTGNIRILPNGGTTVDIPVTLTIAALATVSATPTSLTFDYQVGSSAPSPKQISVSGAGATLAYSATASSTGNWLVVSPATGTTPKTLDVSINPAGLAANTYTGTILVSGTGDATGSTTVNVTLNVTAPLPTLTRVTNAASYATGSIAPGEIITLFAADSTHPIGPATAVAFPVLDATGKVATTLGGVQVLINGFACPMIYASASQVSAVVPYELKLFTSATVLVKFLGQTSNGVLVNVATTLPGIFTQNASGTGPGAILNANNTTNSPSNPATRGDTVVVYMTGEGETSPAGVTGKVTTVAAPPQPLTPAPLLPVSVTIGGQSANWSFAGEAPTFVSGVMQLNVTVPTNIAAGDQAIVVSIGGNQSQQGVTVSVR